MRVLVPILVVLSLACGGLGPGSGTRVVVVRSGTIDAETDAAVADGLAEHLRERGFLASVHPEPVSGDDVDHEARRAASAAGAANAVLLDFSTRAAREGILDGTALHLVSLDVGVVNLDVEHPVEPHTFTFGREASGPNEVEQDTRRHWVEAASGVALRQLYTTPEVAAVVMAEAEIPLEELSAAADIRKRERDVAKATERAFEYEQFCEDEVERMRAMAEAEGLTCTGNPCGGATILGTAGSEVILQHADRVLMFGVPVRDHAVWSEPPERITALDPATGTERELVLAQNLYGLGKVVPGATVGTADWFTADGRDAIVGFRLEDGSMQARGPLEPGQSSSWSAVAPNGSVIAHCVDETDACWMGGEPLPTVRRGDWVSEGPVLVLQDPEQVVHTFAPDGAELGRARVKWQLSQVVGAHDGRIRVLAHRGGDCLLASFAPEAPGKAELTRLPECVTQARSLPDGRLVGVAGGAIVLWTPGADVVQRLTAGTLRDELPYPLGEDRIVFNRRLERLPRAFDTEIYRRIVCTAAVPEG